MRWSVAVAVAVVAIGCGSSQRKPKLNFSNPRLGDFAAMLAEAARAKDVPAMRALFGDVVVIGGMLFSDVECVKQFSYPSKVSGPKLAELARCLTTLSLVKSMRVDSLPDVVVLNYAPGIELEARFIEIRHKPLLRWIGYVARRDMSDALPTVTANTLEALRIDGDKTGPLPANATPTTELAIVDHVEAWLKVCIDGEGTVTSARVREATSPRVARWYTDAVKAWKFRPFTIESHTIPVCALVQLVHPPVTATDDPEVLPLPLPEAPEALTNVPNKMLGKRRSGATQIAPDDDIKRQIAHAGINIIGSVFQFCIDPTGHVMRVQMVRSSGFDRYDGNVMMGIWKWTYAPFVDEGVAVSVCSSVSFIYSQR